MSEPLIDIRPDHWAIVADILRRHVPDREVWAFGSRATWNAKGYSDLDLAVIGETPLSLSVSAALADDFAKSDLPFKVDVVDWATTSEAFRKIIERDKVVAQRVSTRAVLAGQWVETTLGKVTDFLSGGTPSKGQPEYWGGSIPWVSAKDMKRFRIDDTEDHVTEHGVENGTKLVPAGTVLLLTRGMTLLNDLPICITRRPMTFNQDVKALRPKPHVRDDFLPYLLLGNKERLLSLVDLAGHGTGRLNSDELKALDVLLPPEPEQRAIAHILGTLDDKIELNRRMNETLEAMARALFKSWFVDFDPVRAKCRGGVTPPLHPPHLYDLFPTRLVDSELGEIPEGWNVGCVDDEFDLTMGQSPPGDTYNEVGDGLPFYQGRADFGFRFPTRRVYCTAPTRLAKARDTLISVRAPVGDINMASEDCAIGRGVAAARHKTRSRSYSYQFMRSLEVVFARFEAEGTVFGSIGKKDFHAIPCVVPPRDVVVRFETILLPVDSRIEVNERESRTLAALRDTLLPKLISGELRMPTATKMIASVISQQH